MSVVATMIVLDIRRMASVRMELPARISLTKPNAADTRTGLVQRVTVLLQQHDHLAERIPHRRDDLVACANRVDVRQYLAAGRAEAERAKRAKSRVRERKTESRNREQENERAVGGRTKNK